MALQERKLNKSLFNNYRLLEVTAEVTGKVPGVFRKACGTPSFLGRARCGYQRGFSEGGGTITSQGPPPPPQQNPDLKHSQ